MKKLIAIILSAVMLLSFAACSAKEDTKPADTTAPVTNAVDEDINQPAAPGEGPESDMPAIDAPAADSEGAADGESAAQTLLNVFYTEKANPDATAEDIANAIMAHESIQFMPMVANADELFADEEAVFTGFNVKITGYKEAVMFAPGMMGIPFVGYIFELEDGADVEAFKANLMAEANPRWNVCTEAEETLCENVGNTVFFIMCNRSLAS